MPNADKVQPSAQWSPDLASGRIEFTWIGQGTLLGTMFVRNARFPVASVWMDVRKPDGGPTIYDLLDIYVPENLRRRGIARLLVGKLLEQADVLITDHGTEGGGLGLLKSLGFTQDPTLGVWMLRRPTV